MPSVRIRDMPTEKPTKRRKKRSRDSALGRMRNHIADGFVRTLTATARCLPYGARVRFFGWASARLIGPLIRVPRAYRASLSQMFPDFSAQKIAQTATTISDHSGRSLIEMYSGEDFLERVRALPLEGDGVAAILSARDAGRPLVFATAHYGNYNAARAAVVANGFGLAALYRPASNKLLNRHYVKALAAVGGHLFPRNRTGLTGLVRHLKGGKPIMVLFDLHVTKGAALGFFGRRTMTSLSPAELALRHDALLVPFYGTRLDDGLSFRVEIDAPIPHSTPETMMQALNDGLEARIRANPEQWFYLHKRWKLLRGAQQRQTPPTAPDRIS